jgi:ankyrin repeat protein
LIDIESEMYSSRKDIGLELRGAAGAGNFQKCQSIVEQNPHVVNELGEKSKRSALHQAAKCNHVDVVRYLVGKGATSSFDANHDTPYDLTTSAEIKRFLHYNAKGPVSGRSLIVNSSDRLKFG